MSLRELRARLADATILLDYDGSLAPIVDRPQDAVPADGAVEVLATLVDRAGSVTIVTGRPASFVRELLPVPGLEVVGLYGLEGRPALPADLDAAVTAAIGDEPGVHLEDKDASIAVHFRMAPDPVAAVERVGPGLVRIAERARAGAPPRQTRPRAGAGRRWQGVGRSRGDRRTRSRRRALRR